MSVSAERFLSAVADPDIELPQLAAIIKQDPAIVARILGVANSAYFAYPRPVTTIDDAIINVLGLETTKNLTLAIIFSGPFDASQCGAFPLERFWLSSIFTATLAQSLVQLLPGENPPLPGEAYLAGLLHRIGLLALVHLYPQKCTEIFEACSKSCEPALHLEMERERLQLDHAVVGSWLAHKWHLPALAAIVIEHYAETDYRSELWQLTQLVGFASHWACAAITDAEEEGYPCLSELELLGIDLAQAGKGLARVALRFDELREMAKQFV